MKLASLLLLLPLAGCGMIDVVSRVSTEEGEGPQVVGSGKPVVEKRKAQSATAAEFSGALMVEIRRGAPSLTVEAQREILPHIKTSFDHGRLKVWSEGNISTDGTLKVRFSTPNLSEVHATGATHVDAGTLSGSNVKLVLTGASTLKAEGRANRIEVQASGASEASLARMECKSARVEAAGASKVWMGLSESLQAQASGASTVSYRGAPKPLKTEASGVSTIGPAK